MAKVFYTDGERFYHTTEGKRYSTSTIPAGVNVWTITEDEYIAGLAKRDAEGRARFEAAVEAGKQEKAAQRKVKLNLLLTLGLTEQQAELFL